MSTWISSPRPSSPEEFLNSGRQAYLKSCLPELKENLGVIQECLSPNSNLFRDLENIIKLLDPQSPDSLIEDMLRNDFFGLIKFRRKVVGVFLPQTAFPPANTATVVGATALDRLLVQWKESQENQTEKVPNEEGLEEAITHAQTLYAQLDGLIMQPRSQAGIQWWTDTLGEYLETFQVEGSHEVVGYESDIVSGLTKFAEQKGIHSESSVVEIGSERGSSVGVTATWLNSRTLPGMRTYDASLAVTTSTTASLRTRVAHDILYEFVPPMKF
ncbi:hypothetical protein QFC21_003050 [Naganishia friedmannii]|uniref:Uncharacterized protein n=1 Tax=Naganishia friedmannii TaxID=89922 RepID=A0ACC2VS40_9TREE|nr:hypothetical protein QFC21_003050 [Naganishia friedmannii]